MRDAGVAGNGPSLVEGVVSCGFLAPGIVIGALVRDRMLNSRHRDTALLVAAFLVTRGLLYVAGFRFNLELHWMFLADPGALQENFVETIWYFHAFPPGMNILTAALLSLPASVTTTGAVCCFWAAGLVLVLSLALLIERLGLSWRLALLFALGFSILPQSLYFEALYLYTYPCAALLCLSAEQFCRALAGRKARHWFWFFLSCAILGWVRTTFHLLWFGVMIAFSALLVPEKMRRKVLLGAAVPLLVLGGLYAKNWALFGVFGTTSWSGANLTLATTARMSSREREAWIARGELSPFSRLSVFAPPSRYLGLLNSPTKRYPWPGSNDLWRPRVREANFNHGLFIEVNAQRRQDALKVIVAEPMRYLETVLTVNLPAFFSASTHWHPGDSRSNSPHAQHRRVLGRYEKVYDEGVHSFPTRGVGLYWALPLIAAWAGVSGLRQWRAAQTVRAGLLWFCLLQISYVVAVSSMLTAQESSRYRYLIESCIALLVLGAIRALWQWAEQQVHAQAKAE